MNRFTLTLSYFGLGCSLILGLLPSTADASDFNKTIAPILLTNCLECHSGATPSGGLDLTSKEGLEGGGNTGPVIDKDKPQASTLLDRVATGAMPPAKGGKPRPLSPEQVASLRDWVLQGAPWPQERKLDWFETTLATRAGRDWWSLQPIVRQPVPHGEPNPVDAFVRAKLSARGWQPAPAADKRTLLRRLYYDVVGLPPTYEEVEAFAQDTGDDAYARQVDKLLASPHYGERWGRYWLDVARYAETSGYERDQLKQHVWKYRDWVIRAFNDDMPYDQFVREQLAGDELPNRSEATVIATGFLRLGTWNDEPNDPNEYKYDRLEDLVGATSAAFLGLTVRCARCHDHKFDPIRQTDYYRMAASFWAGFIEPGPRELLGGPDAKTLGFDVHGWTDRGRDVPPIKLLKKGDPNRPGAEVPPGHLSLLPKLDQPFKAPQPEAKTTQRRIQLAKWIVDPKNPLTARVWVNRVWQHHFGKGLVRSPDNFGFTGEQPTHPELLDWLASELQANGWRTKPLHRLILLSQTYRQSSLHPRQDEYNQSDAANQLWWRAERRRLDAEALRDSLLFAAGTLRLQPLGGPSFAPDIAPEALEGLSMKGAAWKPSPPEEQNRRSVYVFAKRGLLSPQLTAFDFPDTTLPCGQRDVTTVAPQALTLLNGQFAHAQSQALARRLGEGKPGTLIQRAWRLALGRDPLASEVKAAREHLTKQTQRLGEKQALASLCHVLLNTNEFLYVD